MARPEGFHFLDIRFADRAGLSKDFRLAINIEITKLFRKVSGTYCELYKNAQMPLVSPTFHEYALKPHDLRCFIFNDSSQSLCRRLGSAGLGQGGTTYRGEKYTTSEIYLNGENNIEIICKLIFHEFMHNKLQKGDDLHYDYDAGQGLAREVVTNTGLGNLSTSQITYGNQKIMAQHLFDENPQYPKG